MTKEELEEIKILLQGLGAITMFDETMKRVDKSIIVLDRELSKLHQPMVISAVCTCGVNTRRHFETNLNQCRFCEKPLIQTDLQR